MGLVQCVLLILMTLRASPSAGQEVPAIRWSTVSPSDFADDELDLPYYLQHFSTIANSVVMAGPERGFISIDVWREQEYNTPDNPRIMENVLSLAFFYATDRPWNPYYGHRAVRQRLEAALEFWIDQQDEEGLFTHRVNSVWSLSPTAFTTKFLGETLRLLEGGPPIDRDLLREASETQGRALHALLTREDLYEFAVRFTNQYTNVWGAAGAYLDLYRDPRIQRLFEERLRRAPGDLQSPAGYFYEHDGPDWVYDLETHHSNHRMAWHYLRGTELGNLYAEMVRGWYSWLAYNAVLEPDGSGFTLNRSFETRQSLSFFRDNRLNMYGETCTPLAEVVITARAFCESTVERDRRLTAERLKFEQSWPEVPPLDVGTFSAYSPYAFLHRSHIQWHPTPGQKSDARASLPSGAREHYIHQRSDDRHSLIVTYINKPAYYAAFSTGQQTTPQQRYGLGLVAAEGEGAVLQSPSNSSAAWGTLSSNETAVYETSISDQRMEIDGRPINVAPRPRNLPDGTFSISYPLGSRGQKTITFLDDAISVDVRHEGSFTENIPLLVASDDDLFLEAASGTLRSGSWSVAFSDGATATVNNEDARVGRKRMVSLRLDARNTLRYELRFAR